MRSMSRYEPQMPHLKPPHVRRRREGEEETRQERPRAGGTVCARAGVAAVINSLLNLSWSDLRERREEMADKDCVAVAVVVVRVGGGGTIWAASLS